MGGKQVEIQALLPAPSLPLGGGGDEEGGGVGGLEKDTI